MHQAQSTVPTVTLKGASGAAYAFEVYRLDTSFNAVAVVYAISARDPELRHSILYVGQTANLPERFANHHRAPCFTRLGATHVLVFQKYDESERLEIETDLRRFYDPHCNRQ